MKIPDFKTYLKESHWSEMNRRSQGTVKRKEDDINLMDINGFCRYLNTIYEYPTEPEHNICCGTIYITIPLFVYNNIRRSILLYPEGGCALVRGPLFDRWPDDLKKYLDTQYFVEYKMDENKDYMYFIGPNEGKGDNKFFIKLLDDIIIHVDYPLLRKKVNESHWSEMNKRSQGITVRKEDDVNLLDDEAFLSYLQKNYKFNMSDANIGMSKEYDDDGKTVCEYIYIPIYSPRPNDNTTLFKIFSPSNMVQIPKCMIDEYPSLYNELCNVFSVLEDNYFGDYFMNLEPKNKGDVDNKFFLKVMDFIIDYMNSDNNPRIKKILEKVK